MKDLNYIIAWNKNIEQTWSGTAFSLKVALERYYKIYDYTLKPQSTLRNLIAKLYPSKNDFIDFIMRNRKSLKHLKGTVFQFYEILKDDDYRPTYIYQDLIVDYLYNLKVNNYSLFELSGFLGLSTSTLKRRNALQLDYFKTASGIFTMGKWLKKYIDDNLPELACKTYHVGGGININPLHITYECNKTNNKILFVGRDFKRKGGECVIQAYRLLKNKMPNAELHVAGPESNPVSEYIDGYYYYGDLDSSGVQDLMNKCDIFCMPSYFEAYGLVFLEALVSGLPCIGRNCYEMPYFIEEGKTGELVYEDNPEELAEKILKIFNNSNYKQEVLKRRDFYINEYSWDNVAKRITNIIEVNRF